MKMDLKKVLNFTLILLLLQSGYSTEEASPTEETPTEVTTDTPEENSGTEADPEADLNDTLTASEMNLLNLPDCNVKILNAYGFTGQKRGLSQELGMCPGIKESCCTNEDQLKLYEMWIAAKGKEHLENKFKIQTEVVNIKKLISRFTTHWSKN